MICHRVDEANRLRESLEVGWNDWRFGAAMIVNS
jgi:hypothetical protein